MYDLDTISAANAQASARKYSNETPQQQAKHREIGLNTSVSGGRKVGGSARDYRRMVELEIVLAHQYGPMLPEDDAGRDAVLTIWMVLCHPLRQRRL